MATDFDTALSRGCYTVYSLRIEGIPYVFTEGTPKSVFSGTTVGWPWGYLGIRPSLMVLPGHSVECSISRETGVASAKSLDVVLAFADPVTGSLFQRPSKSHVLTADVAATDTVLQVDSEPAGASVYYIGREALEYVSNTATTLTVTRGWVGSQPWAYKANDASSYGVVTDKPTIWKGRQVWLFEHLVSPEGRMFDVEVGREDDYSRLLWSGYIEEPPQPGPHGMVLRCQALVRLAAKDLGFQFDLKPIGVDTSTLWSPGSYPIGVTDAARVGVFIEVYSGGSLYSSHIIEAPNFGDSWVPTAMTLDQWWTLVEDAIHDEVSAQDWYMGQWWWQTSYQNGAFVYQVEIKGGYSAKIDIYVGEHTPWLRPGFYHGADDDLFSVPLAFWDEKATGWLAVEVDEGSHIDGITVPQTGYGMAEAQGGTELFGWDQAVKAESIGPKIWLIKVSRRGINGTPSVPLWDSQTEITMLSGVMGPFGECIATLLESSGTGLRGDYDTLDRAQGLGLHEDSIDVDGVFTGILTRAPNDEVTLVQDGRVSVEGLVGGWLVLHGLCLAQNNGVLGLVPIVPIEDSDAEIIGPSDVILASIEPYSPVLPKNSIRIERSGIGAEVRPLVVQDTMAMQAEGTQALDLTAPGMEEGKAGQLARIILANNKGQQALRVKLAPWKRLRVGQMVAVGLAHPMIYDWGSGVRGPSSVPALVAGVETHLHDGTHTVTLLMGGLDEGSRYLCPCAVVSAFGASDVTVDEPQWFRPGESVQVYNPGSEDTESDTLVIDSISGNIITMTTTLPDWVAIGTIVTFPPSADASNRQAGYAYVRSDFHWRS